MARKSSPDPIIWIVIIALAAPIAILAWLWETIGAWGFIAIALLSALIFVLGITKRYQAMAVAASAENDRLSREIAIAVEAADRVRRENADFQARIDKLRPYQAIVDVENHLKSLHDQAAGERGKMLEAARDKLREAEEQIKKAAMDADKLIADAKSRAEAIAGEAYEAKNRKEEYEEAAKAIRNIIDGYGDEYIAPTYSLLDELADSFGHAQAGQHLKQARDWSRQLVKLRRAATCDYAEESRRETAIRFVTDAFNGKVDSILSRTKADNVGILSQQIKDAFALVNSNGAAFRNARVTKEYLDARLDELKWGTIAHELREQEREEQRRIKEQIREEERAQREFERAMKDAAKEEETIRKAMEKVQQQVAAANDAQRAEYEAKLRDLEEKLQAAEEKNQRALSMAQQTRTGHVYVISNPGSFGEEVFKIGMTRRLEPTDRIRELGDASVPFEFDIHAMIFSEDAPALEKTLHRHFLRQQMNKVNPRKEFFRLSIGDIRQEVEGMGIAAHWTMTAEAHDFRETLRIEQQIRENPEVEKEWTQHQLESEAEPLEDEAIS